MADHKKLEFPSNDLKNHFLPQFLENRYSVIDSSRTDNYILISDDYRGQALYTEIYDKNSKIDYKDIVKAFTNFPSYKYPFPTITYNKCLEMVKTLDGGYTHKEIDQFKKGIFYCDTKYLEDLLKVAFEDVFFNKFPEGKIISVRLDSLYYKRSGMIRGMYALNHYPDIKSKITDFNGFNTLKNWLMIESHEIFSSVLGFAEHFFFPFVTAFHANYRIGLYFIFIPTIPVEYKLDNYPRDIMDFIRTGSDFGKQKINNLDWTNENLYAKYCFNPSPSFNESEEFIVWAVDKSNNFIKRYLDINNFTEAKDLSKIDPIFSLEYNLSLLHLIKICLSILSSHNIYFNKSITFQAADLLGELSNYDQFGLPSSVDFFKMLFNKDKIIPVIEGVLNNSQLSFRNKLISTVNHLYNNLNETIKNSVWLDYRINGNDIIVKDKSLTNDINEDISLFTSNVIRVLRNTHHGYFSRNDQNKRPSRYLSLVDGNIPDSFSSLTLFWLLCLLEDRNSFIGSP